jgi:hypothetical protein
MNIELHRALISIGLHFNSLFGSTIVDQRLTIRLVSANGKKGFPLGGVRVCHSGRVLFREPTTCRMAVGPPLSAGMERRSRKDAAWPQDRPCSLAKKQSR